MTATGYDAYSENSVAAPVSSHALRLRMFAGVGTVVPGGAISSSSSSSPSEFSSSHGPTMKSNHDFWRH